MNGQGRAGDTMNFEDALISRKIKLINKDEVLIEEHWDLTHPSCPFVMGPFSNQYQSPHITQTVMRREQHEEMNPKLK